MDFYRGRSRTSFFKKIIYYLVILFLVSLSIYRVFCVSEDMPSKVVAGKENNTKYIAGKPSSIRVQNDTENKNRKPFERIKALLQSYGLSMKNILNIEKVSIPENFCAKPEGLYWACCNEYSKAIGLDFSSYKGKEVSAYTFSTKQNRDVIILLDNQDIIGGWVTFNSIKGMSLSSKVSLTSLASRWGDWLKENNIVDYNSELEKENKKLSCEEVINKHYYFINNKDRDNAFSLYSKLYQSSFLYSKSSDSKIYNSLRDLLVQDFYDVENIKILSLKYVIVKKSNYNAYFMNVDRAVADLKYFSMLLDYKVNGEEKKEKYLVRLVKECNDAPWKIDYICQYFYDDY